MSEYSLEPYPVHHSSEIASAMHELLATNVPSTSYAQANREVLRRLGHVGVIKRYGGSEAVTYAQKGIDDHRLWEEGKGGSAHYLIRGERRKVIGTASIQPSPVLEENLNSVGLYEVKYPVPPVIAKWLGWRKPIEVGTHLVSAWTHINDDGHEAEVDVYVQLVEEVRKLDQAACAWTTLPDRYIDRMPLQEQRRLARSLGRVATGSRYDVLESKWQIPQPQNLLVDPERFAQVAAGTE